jgi:tetratricopeptide (TPR) repeat protein
MRRWILGLSFALLPFAPCAADVLFADGLKAYEAALRARRLGQADLRKEDIARRVAEGELLMSSGRVDEAIARLGALVESDEFASYADSDDGHAAVFRLGDALAQAGIIDAARGYLRRVIVASGAWDRGGTWTRRAVRRLVDMALETEQYAPIVRDLSTVPPSAPEEVLGEIAYLRGRAQEAAGSPDAAAAAYATVPQRSRFWSQATYLAALISVERGNYSEGEKLLCKVADPKRAATTTPVFADEKFFAVRDLARLGLGRVAHEQGRNDDARYYYYLVPRDSDRLAEALYEAATTRYEKKDYEGARELLDELSSLGIHHRYEDEAWVLDAWVDLARCRFADADKKLRVFLARYEPVRDTARRIADGDVAMQRLLAAVQAGTDAGGAEIGGAGPETVRTIAALVRLDPAYGRVLARRAVLEREGAGLVYALRALGDMQRSLSTSGALRPAIEAEEDGEEKPRDARRALEGLGQQLAALEAAGIAGDRIAPFRLELDGLKTRLSSAAPPASPSPPASGVDLGDLLRRDTGQGAELQNRIAAQRTALAEAETALARDTLHRLDMRLSRLLRRARLGRIETILGRKRALEVEVEAIKLGYLPQDAVDSLDAARYLEDNEEYWPFEGDDWPDEYVGAEIR